MIELNGKTYSCPVEATLGLLTGKWKVAIIHQLCNFNSKSYTGMKANLKGVSEKMLSQQLKEMEKNKLIGKNVLSEKPYRVEYFLTERGKSIIPLYDLAGKWGLVYLKDNEVQTNF